MPEEIAPLEKPAEAVAPEVVSVVPEVVAPKVTPAAPIEPTAPKVSLLSRIASSLIKYVLEGVRGFFLAFIPNENVPNSTMSVITILQIGTFVYIWWKYSPAMLPNPVQIWEGFQFLWYNLGLAGHLWTSFKLSMEALLWSTVISLGLSYLSVIGFFRPIVLLISKGRYLSLSGLSFTFVLYLGDHGVKLWMLVFGISVFFITSMANIVCSVPQEEIDYARTLRMGPLRVIWEIQILGHFHDAIEIVRQCGLAMGWMMLPMVEGLQRSEGGVGVLLKNGEKYLQLSQVYSIMICIWIIAFAMDFTMVWVRNVLCPYAQANEERR